MAGLALLVLAVGLARGENEPDIEPEVSQENATESIEFDGEMVIPSDTAVERSRAELEREIRNLGYREGEIRGDRVVYRPADAWKPSIILHEDGFVLIRRTPPRFEPWIESDAPIGYLSCVPPFTLLCINVQGILVSDRRLQHQKTDVTEAIQPLVAEWRQAIGDRSMRVRTRQEIPASLHEVWFSGHPMTGEDRILTDPESRRSDILDFWSSRTCTPEGQAVRDVVVDFLRREVQTSSTPLTATEIIDANRNTTCEDTLPWPLEPTGSEA